MLYNKVKALFPNAVAFIRIGESYETFDEDAKLAAQMLGLELTTLDGRPRASFPVQCAEDYKRTLARAGHWVILL